MTTSFKVLSLTVLSALFVLFVLYGSSFAVFLPAVAGTIYTCELSETICSCACTHGKAFVQVARWDCDQAGF
jgi:hypothetical protein